MDSNSEFRLVVMAGVAQGEVRKQVRTAELKQVMALIFNQIVPEKRQIINQAVEIIQPVPDEYDYKRDFLRLEGEIETLKAKKTDCWN